MISVLLLLLVWILMASVFNRSPVGLLTATVDYMFGEEVSATHPSYADLRKQNERKDSLITELQTALKMLEKSSNYQQAVVTVESESLNLRSQPSLSSDVVLQLPVGSVVEILYYDNETYRIGGEYGKWCKVSYTDKEGWVWGNYLRLIE